MRFQTPKKEVREEPTLIPVNNYLESFQLDNIPEVDTKSKAKSKKSKSKKSKSKSKSKAKSKLKSKSKPSEEKVFCQEEK